MAGSPAIETQGGRHRSPRGGKRGGSRGCTANDRFAKRRVELPRNERRFLMYLVTNRSVDENGTTPALFGREPSEKGPNEIRVVEAVRRNNAWRCTILPDEVTKAQQKEVGLGVVTIPKDALPIASHSHFVSFAAIVKWAGGPR